MTYNDGLSRLTNKSYSGACGVTTAAVAYGYDATTPAGNKGIGKRTSMSDAAGSTLWEYSDNRGRLTKETKTITGVGNHVTQWGYDSGDLVTSMIYPDGESVTTAYNTQQLPISLSSSWWPTTPMRDSITYDEANRVRQIRLPGDTTATTNDLWRTYLYYPWQTAGGRLQFLLVGTNPGWGDRRHSEYRYDTVGNISEMSLGNISETAYTGWSAFSYDAADRLLQGYGLSYTYDNSNGRLTNYEGNSLGYTNSSHPHAVTQVNGVTRYQYDANGNMITRNLNLSTQQNLSWDHENRLVSISGGGLPSESYVYDGDGQRVKKISNGVTTAYINAFTEVTGSAMTKYYYLNGERVVMRTNASGVWLHYDLHGDHPST